jgi:4-diphosphocytidyl-2-C-methyl-D-erythritol kinase
VTATGSTPPGWIAVRVPAKINLFLAVRGTRPDGYHEVTTILQTVSLHDRIDARLVGDQAACQHPTARRRMRLAFTHDTGDDLPDDATNLVVRAALTLAGEAGVNLRLNERAELLETGEPTTHLHLDKAIPLAAGMAGGSADAAGTLVALDRLWGCELDRTDLQRVASELGADVPFCLVGGRALATGTGTATARVLSPGSYDWVLVAPDGGLAAGDVYRVWDEVAAPSEAGPDAVLEALRTNDPVALGAALHNDLEAAVLHLRPDLRQIRDALLGDGALGAIVSGSGPVVVGLAHDPVTAAELAGSVARRGLRTMVVRGPAGGPEFVDPR